MAQTMSDLERTKLEEDIELLMSERRRRLNALMEEKNLTYIELEKKTGVAKSSIQRYLSGETAKIPIDFFEKVAIVTNTPVEYLTCFDIQKNTSIGDDRGDLADEIQKLDEQKYEQVKQFVKFISGNK